MKLILLASMDVRFKTPANFYISGQSQCGKSYLVWCMLRNLNKLFDPFPSRIIYCYGEYQHAFDDMVQTIPNIYFTEGFRDNLYGILEGYQNSLVIIVSRQSVQKINVFQICLLAVHIIKEYLSCISLKIYSLLVNNRGL